MKGCQACVLKSTHQGQEVSAQLGNGSPDANVGGARPRVVVEGEGASLQPDMQALSGVGFCPGSPGQQEGRTACPTACPLCAACEESPKPMETNWWHVWSATWEAGAQAAGPPSCWVWGWAHSAATSMEGEARTRLERGRLAPGAALWPALPLAE